MRKLRKIIRNILLTTLILLAAGYYSIPALKLVTNDSFSTLRSSVSEFITPDSASDPTPPKKVAYTTEQRYWNYYFPENQREEHNETANTRTWAHPTANVFIDIQNNPELTRATREAIQNWNKTKVFKFREVNNRNRANITVHAIDNSNTTAAGVTSTTYNPITGHLLTARIALNTHYLQNKTYDYGYRRIMYTAEHELGHSIGLKHANNSSVMYPRGSYYPIQIQDIRAVRSLYA